MDDGVSSRRLETVSRLVLASPSTWLRLSLPYSSILRPLSVSGSAASAIIFATTARLVVLPTTTGAMHVLMGNSMECSGIQLSGRILALSSHLGLTFPTANCVGAVQPAILLGHKFVWASCQLETDVGA